MRTAFLLTCFLTLALRPALAQTAPQIDTNWLKKPYPLKVVLHVHPHPVLTEDFVRQLRLELSAGLKQHFGGVVDVRVIDANACELMKDVLSKGWSVMDDRNLVQDEKEHLIQLRFVQGSYELEARQWDGFTGLCSQLRSSRTPDRSWVSRQATLMVVQDFGVVAELPKESLPKNVKEAGVKLQLKGWGLQDRSQAMRLQSGEVFAFTRIKQDPDGKLRSYRVPDALLVVTIYDDRDDYCNANWHARFKKVNPFAPDGRTIAFRALKLGTRQAPLKLQLVDKQTGNPVTGTRVVVRRGEGTEVRDTPLTPVDGAPGTYESQEQFAHFAKVVVLQGNVTLAEVPVPLMSEDSIPLELTGTQAAIKLAEFDYDYTQWRRPLFETIDMIDRRGPQLGDLVRQGRAKRPEALTMAKELATALESDLTQLTERFKGIKELAAQAGDQAKGRIAEGDKFLGQLALQLKNYKELIQRMENPSPAQELMDQAQIAEDSYDFEQAIRLYRESLQKEPDQPRLKKRLDTMVRAWQIKDNEHRAARQFIANDWAKSDWQQLEDKVADLQKHVDILKRSRDHLTGIMLVNINQKHLKKLVEVQANLGNNEADQEKGKSIGKVNDALDKINTDLLNFYTDAVRN